MKFLRLRLTSGFQGAEMDARVEERHVVDKTASIVARGKRVSAFMYDLSVTGCMIECDHSELAQGDAVRVELGDSIDVSGAVMWAIGSNAGIKFDAELHDAVVQFSGFSRPLLDVPFSIPRDRYDRDLLPQ